MVNHNMSKLPHISVIISAYSMERYEDITALLDSLYHQTYRDFDILLVIDKSKELYTRLEELAKEKGYTNMHVLFNTSLGGLSKARNIGVQNTQGEIIAFIDDDAVAFPEWLQEIAETFKDDNHMIGMTGPAIPLWENAKLSWLPEEFYWIYSCMHPKWKGQAKVRNVWGTNMAFSREAFLICGYFKESFGIKGGDKKGWSAPGAEETDFSIRATSLTGKHIIYNPLMKIKHRVYVYRSSWRFISRRAFWEGCSKSMLKRLHKGQNSHVLSNEYDLLKRIFFHLIPMSIAGLGHDFKNSWHKLTATVVIVSCVAFGYTWGMVRPLR